MQKLRSKDFLWRVTSTGTQDQTAKVYMISYLKKDIEKLLGKRLGLFKHNLETFAVSDNE